MPAQGGWGEESRGERASGRPTMPPATDAVVAAGVSENPLTSVILAPFCTQERSAQATGRPRPRSGSESGKWQVLPQPVCGEGGEGSTAVWVVDRPGHVAGEYQCQCQCQCLLHCTVPQRPPQGVLTHVCTATCMSRRSTARCMTRTLLARTERSSLQ